MCVSAKEPSLINGSSAISTKSTPGRVIRQEPSDEVGYELRRSVKLLQEASNDLVKERMVTAQEIS